MSTEEYSPSRPPRRNSRTRSRRDKRDSTAKPYSKKSADAKPKKKKSLIHKILGLFTGKKAKTSGKPAGTQQREKSHRSSTSPRTPRSAPEPVEVTSPRLYVGNLSYDATESDLHEIFNGVGLVKNVEVVINKHTQRSKGFGFVQMQTIDEAKRAVSELHDKEYMNRKLVVSGAKAEDSRSAS